VIPVLISQDKFPIALTDITRVLGNYFFNLFLVTGSEKSVLFETGVSGVVDTVIHQLEGLNIEPDYLVVSHPHSDHITGLPGLMNRFPSATVICGKGAIEFASHPKAGEALVREDHFVSKGLSRIGLIPGRPPLDASPDLNGAMVIETSTRLDLGGGISIDLIPVKGHSPGNLIGQVANDHTIFCSDSLGFHYPDRGFWPLFFTDADEYLNTIDLMESLSPVILAPAHQGPITGGKVSLALNQARSMTLATIKRVNETCLCDNDLAQELFDDSYRDEFTLYTRENIMNCAWLLMKRARIES